MYDETLPDWARPRTEAELWAEHCDYEFGARYDCFDGYGDPDDCPDEYDDESYDVPLPETYGPAYDRWKAGGEPEIPF